MQVIEVDHMVLDILRQLHDVANNFGILWDGDADCAFDRTHRSERVHRGAHPTDAFAESPCVAGIAALQNDLDPTPHGAGGNGVADDIAVVENRLDAQMAFNASNWIDYYTFGHGSLLLARVLIGRGRGWLFRFQLVHLFAHHHRGEMRCYAYARKDRQGLADLVRCRFDSRHQYIRKALVEGTVVPEILLGASNAGMPGVDRPALAAVPFE